jgi:hypothetical protein
MVKYRLKDRELQKKLDVWSKGLFSIALQKSGKEQLHGQSPDVICEFTGLIIGKSEIEAFEEYDPNDWNNFPEVQPPEDVLMRVETTTGRKFCGYYHTFVEGGCWCYQAGTVCPEATSKSVKRFRTWE